MSLFIAGQAFGVEADFEAAKIAVFAASVLSAADWRDAALDCGERHGAMIEEGVDRQFCVGPLTPIPALPQRPHVDANDR